MDIYKTIYDQTIKDKLTDFKNYVDDQWIKYLNDYSKKSKSSAGIFTFVPYLEDASKNKILKEECEKKNNFFEIATKNDYNYLVADEYIRFDNNSYTKVEKCDFYFEKINKDFPKSGGDYFLIKLMKDNGLTPTIDNEGFFNGNNFEKGIPRFVDALSKKVFKTRDELFELALNYHLVIFSGGTGTGKSTEIPKFFLEYGFAQKFDKKPLRIAMTQPRRLAVDTITESLRKESGLTDDTFALKYRGKDTKTKSTLVQVMTEGSLLALYDRKKIKNPNYAFDEYSVIIIDEAHSRNLDTDRLLKILKNEVLPKRINNKDKPFCAVIMSATANLDLFCKYFEKGYKNTSIENTDKYKDIKEYDNLIEKSVMKNHTVIVKGTQYPIKVIQGSTGYKNYIDEVINLTKKIHKNTDSLDDEDTSVLKPYEVIKNEHLGFILVFLPTKADIMQCIESINTEPLVDNNGYYLFALGLYSEIINKTLIDTLESPEEILNYVNKIISGIEKVENGEKYIDKWKGINNIKRVVIFATNVAEASVTIDGLQHCIDTGLENKSFYNPYTETTMLVVVPTSKANMLQRKGRVGRRETGNYYPLFSSEIWSANYSKKDYLDNNNKNGITNITGIILDIKRHYSNLINLNYYDIETINKRISKDITKLDVNDIDDIHELEFLLINMEKTVKLLIMPLKIEDIENIENTKDFTKIKTNIELPFKEIEKIPIEHIEKLYILNNTNKKIENKDIINLTTKVFTQLYFDTEPQILNTDISNMLLSELITLPKEISSIFRNYITKPKMDFITVAINKFRKYGLLDNTTIINVDDELKLVISLNSISFESKMILYKLLKNDKFHKVFLPCILMVSLIETMKSGKTIFVIPKKPEEFMKWLKETAFVEDSWLFTNLAHIYKYLIKLHEIKKTHSIKDDDYKNLFDIKELTELGEIKEEYWNYKVIIEVLNLAFELFTSLIDYTKPEKIDTVLFNYTNWDKIKIPNAGAWTEPQIGWREPQFLNLLQFLVLEGYFPQLLSREEDKYIDEKGIIYRYTNEYFNKNNDYTTYLPKNIIGFTTNLTTIGYFITNTTGIDNDIIDIFKKNRKFIDYNNDVDGMIGGGSIIKNIEKRNYKKKLIYF